MSRPNAPTKTQAAQLRASISTLLANAPNQDFATEDIAETLQLSTRAAGQMLGYMAKGKLIAGPIKHKGDARKHWKWLATPGGVPPAPKPANPVSPKVVPPTDEVELLVNGRLIVVGTNPTTGRLRITIET